MSVNEITGRQRRNPTSDIATVVRGICKVDRHLNVHKLLRRKTQPVNVTSSNLVIGVEIIDLGVQVGNLQRYEIRPRIDGEVRESRECEVCRVGHKLRRDGTVKVARRSREWCILVDREPRDPRDEEDEKNSDAKQSTLVSQGKRENANA